MHEEIETGSEGSVGYFPRKYLTDFLRFLKANETDIKVLSYADLPWQEGDDPDKNYPGEFAQWRAWLQDNPSEANKAFVLLQYDVDQRPERTEALLFAPEHADVPANVMLLKEPSIRANFTGEGHLYHPVHVFDYGALQAAERRGCQIGYHCNAYERAGFDPDRALEIMDCDLRELSCHFSIRFMSAHGGKRGPDGLRNRDLPLHPAWRDRILWVHNGRTARFKRTSTDGAHYSTSRDPAERDLRDFIRGMQPGTRYRIVLHPQYYDEIARPSPRYSGTSWYDDLLLDRGDTWADVRLGHAPGAAA